MGSTGTGNHGNKVAPGDKRLHIDGLMPDTKYAIQVRAVDNGVDSKWSQKYHVTTIDDTINGNRKPKPPQLKEWKVDASGQYIAIWDTVTHYDDGDEVVVNHYELELVAVQGTVIMAHYGQQEGEQSRSFNFGVLRAYFGGQIPTTIQCRMRVINAAGFESEWTDFLEASLPVPNPPTNPQAKGAVDAVKVTWEPPTDPIHLFGYRVYLSMTDKNFIPDSLGKSNLVYQGPALEFSYTSLSYDLMHYFKIVSYSEPGLESTWVEAEAQPTSPYGPDKTPPGKPTLLAPSLDREIVTNPKALLAWEFDDTLENNVDVSGFVIRWRLNTETRWRNAYFDKAARQGVVDLPRPFSNYVFEISAYDFVANYSDYEGTTQTLNGANPNPPVAVVGLDAVARWDGLRIFWNESDESVKYGGFYEVQYNTTGTWEENAPVDYTTAALSIDITGLNSLQEYFYRVRAVDSEARRGAWSTVNSKTLPAFPTGNTLDGEAPDTAPQNVRSIGGLNYVNVAWDRVSNADPVWYEVFMNVEADVPEITEANYSTFFVGESTGTSLMVASDSQGDMLQQETEYHFMVRARDGDEAGPASVNVTGVLTKALSTDLGINVGGENLLYNSSFDVDSDSNGVADYWEVHRTPPSSENVTPTIVPGRDGEGFAQKIQWSGTNTGIKAIRSKDAKVLRKNTEYMVSFYALSNGSDFSLSSTTGLTSITPDPDNEVPSTTVWKRYIFKVVTGTSPADYNVMVSNVNTVNNGWFTIDDMQIEAGNIASAYKTGTVSIAKLTSGRMSTAEMIIDAQGIVKSTDYDPMLRKGWAIHQGGVDIFRGKVDASALVSDSIIGNRLYVANLIEISTGGFIRSSNYHDGTPVNGVPKAAAGFSVNSAGIDIRSGVVAAGTLTSGIITAPDIRVGGTQAVPGKITIDQHGRIQSNNYAYTPPVGSIPASGTGWKISSKGIEMWDSESKINVNALETSTLQSTVITMGSGGIIQSATWASGVGPRWALQDGPDGGFTMYEGTITGAVVKTGALTSLNDVEVKPGDVRPAFDINAGGYVAITGLRVYGNMLVGTGNEHAMQSGNYNGPPNGLPGGGTTGWKIFGSGVADFHQMNAFNARIYGSTVIGGAYGTGEITSTSYSPGSGGWRVGGDGAAEFNNGNFRVNSPDGSSIRMYSLPNSAPTPGAQIRLYRPGEEAAQQFSIIRAMTNNVLEIRNAKGGEIELQPPWYTGRTVVKITNDADIEGLARIARGIIVEGGGINIQSGGLALDGGLNVRNGGADISGAQWVSRADRNHMTNVSGTAKREMLIDGSWIVGGQPRSSTIRVKENVVDFTYSKEEVLALRPVHYNLKSEFWSEDFGGENIFSGVIAEEAEEAGLLDFVIYDTDGQVEDFDYPRFTSALLHVAREQQKEIDDLRRAVEKLQG